MAMIYARIADRTVAEKYFNVTEKVEALYDQPGGLPADDEGGFGAEPVGVFAGGDEQLRGAVDTDTRAARAALARRTRRAR
jgi:hypothetical protein